jgi:hypothetical protein
VSVSKSEVEVKQLIDVMGFLFVQLYDGVGSRRACATAEAGFTVKMATEKHPLVRFLWAKELNAKDIQKETFRVYGGKCLSRKTVSSWVENFSQGRPKAADDSRPGAEQAETTVKRLLCCGFQSNGTSVSLLVEDMSRNKYFPPKFGYHIFYVVICSYVLFQQIRLPIQTSSTAIPSCDNTF